ncbi:MAG: lipoprotein signal peptidase [Leptospiraceae bacterium]|nr:lipoprotein signal peptidase [Leptospiraceae bacterium]
MKYFEKKFFEVYKPNYLVFILIGVLIDLITKYLVIQNYAYHKSVCYIGEIFCMTLTFNTGFVFGILPNNSLISLISTGLAIIFILLYRWKFDEIANPWGWNLIMVGAFGNFIDKFFIKMPPGGGIKFGFTPTEHGQYIGVVDFLDFDWPDFLLFQRWPAFNFADSCVSVGLTILIVTMMIYEKRLAKENEEAEKKAAVK